MSPLFSCRGWCERSRAAQIVPQPPGGRQRLSQRLGLLHPIRVFRQQEGWRHSDFLMRWQKSLHGVKMSDQDRRLLRYNGRIVKVFYLLYVESDTYMRSCIYLICTHSVFFHTKPLFICVFVILISVWRRFSYLCFCFPPPRHSIAVLEEATF